MFNTIAPELQFGIMNAVVGASLYGAFDICLSQRVQRGRGGVVMHTVYTGKALFAGHRY